MSNSHFWVKIEKYFNTDKLLAKPEHVKNHLSASNFVLSNPFQGKEKNRCTITQSVYLFIVFTGKQNCLVN